MGVPTWTIVTIIIIVYCVLCIGIGYIAGRRFRKTIEDFFVLSRTAGFIVVFLSIASTYHSAFAFLTSVAVFASAGISFWIAAMAWTTLAAIWGYFYGKRAFLLGKAKGFITPADMLADYYQSEALRVITAIIQAVFIIAYITVQAIGLGIILSIASAGHIPYTWASLALMLVAAIYVVIGGLRAAYWTDVMQGIWMYIGVWVAGILIALRFFPGGVGQIFAELHKINPSMLVLRWSPDLLTSFMIVYSVGLMLLPHIWIKYYASRDTWTIKWSSVGTAIYLSSYYIPAALVGLAAAVLNVTGAPGLAPGFIKHLISIYGSRDAVMAYMIYNFTPPIIAGFLLAGAAAAAMSTLDSFLGTTSLILTRDLYQRYLRPKASEKELVIVGRLLLLAWAFIGWYFAILKPGLIFNITAIACAGGLQFLPAILQVIIPTKRNWVNRQGAIAGIIVGSIITAVLAKQIGGRILPISFHPAEAGMIGLAVNFLISFVISAFTKPVPKEKRLEYYELLKNA
ncbi:MAG: sodium:solute symporter family protein [Crenarchaeota archaeon]|nr:sodium:solute symporter family protein [Thermoproteota archaeon]